HAAYFPDGNAYAWTADDANVIHQWNVATGKEVRTFKGHSAKITVVKASDDGKLLVSTGEDQTFRVWDCSQGAELRQLALSKPTQNGAIGIGGVLSAIELQFDFQSSALTGRMEKGAEFCWELGTGEMIDLTTDGPSNRTLASNGQL